MTDRAVAAVLDAALCLLLVSASVLTLVAATPVADTPIPDDDAARRGLSLLTTTTATVEYRHVDRPHRRTARGTVTALLADAAVVKARDGGVRGFVAAVTRVAARRLSRLPVAAQVRVRRPGSERTALVAGRTPPDGAAVSAAWTAVPRENVTVIVRTWSA